MTSQMNPGNTSKILYSFKSRNDVPNDFTGICKINKNCNSINHYDSGKLHRINGPAIEYESGDKFYYVDDKIHREDGPAVEYSNGDKIWCINGKQYGINNDFTTESWVKFQEYVLP